MKLYEFVAIFIIPITLFYFSIDYLTDTNITKDETKIGILQMLHHIWCSICFSGAPIAFFVLKDLKYTTLSIILLFLVQLGFLINKDHCWWVIMINKMTNTSVNRKWISDLNSFIKYYIRGSEWANGDIHPDFNYKYQMPLFNIMYIITLMKFIG
jgi:hypothetical protein